MQEALLYIYAAARINPEQPAIIFVDRVITYKMLLEGILSVESVFADMRLDQNRAVGILVANPARHLIIALALAKSGFSSSSLTKNLLHRCAAVGIHTVITDQSIAEPGLRVHAVSGEWFARTPTSTHWHIHPQPENRIMRVIFTSGSTGYSKAFGHSNRASFARILDRSIVYRVGDERVNIMFGLSTEVGMCLSLRVLMQGRTLCFDEPENESLHLLHFLSVGLVAGSPQQLADLVRQQRRYQIRARSIRQIYSAGSLMTADLLADLKACFSAEIFDTYGSTEAGTTATASGTLLDERRDKGARLVPVKDIKIVDDAGDITTGEGRIAIRSNHMAWPFAGSLVETDSIKGDGWFYPGETGAWDEEGLLRITGRSDELLNFGGVKVAPDVVESLLKRHPDIKDIAVVRLNSAGQSGFEIGILIVAPPDMDRAAVRDLLTRHNMPADVRLMLHVDAIPRTDMGKVARDQVRKHLMA